MKKFIPFLLWILFLYFISWFHTRMRVESIRITTGKKLNKILFFINPSNGISIVSIISGLFAHFSLMIFVILFFKNNIVQQYAELILRFWELSGISLLCVGETIETYIIFKREEARKKRWELLGLVVILICSVVVILYITIIYGLTIYKVLFK